MEFGPYRNVLSGQLDIKYRFTLGENCHGNTLNCEDIMLLIIAAKSIR